MLQFISPNLPAQPETPLTIFFFLGEKPPAETSDVCREVCGGASPGKTWQRAGASLTGKLQGIVASPAALSCELTSARRGSAAPSPDAPPAVQGAFICVRSSVSFSRGGIQAELAVHGHAGTELNFPIPCKAPVQTQLLFY